MISWLKKKRKTSRIKFVEVDAQDLSNFNEGIDNLQNHDIDGFLIRNVLNEHEIQSILNGYARIPKKDIVEVNEGMYIYPTPFSHFNDSGNDESNGMSDFFQSAYDFWNTFGVNFEMDFIERMQSVVQQMGGNRDVTVPLGVNDVGTYHPATIRYLEPGKGEFNVHCGNFFHKEFPSFYEHMSQISTIQNQMSYFVLLQNAEAGGELTVFDLYWDEAEIRTGGVIETKSGKKWKLDGKGALSSVKVKPQVGDMIIFSGGRVWHKVEKPIGTKGRFTIGGFLSLSKDDKSIYLWS